MDYYILHNFCETYNIYQTQESALKALNYFVSKCETDDFTVSYEIHNNDHQNYNFYIFRIKEGIAFGPEVAKNSRDDFLIN